jgi:hypothetical protein
MLGFRSCSEWRAVEAWSGGFRSPLPQQQLKLTQLNSNELNSTELKGINTDFPTAIFRLLNHGVVVPSPPGAVKTFILLAFKLPLLRGAVIWVSSPSGRNLRHFSLLPSFTHTVLHCKSFVVRTYRFGERRQPRVANVL